MHATSAISQQQLDNHIYRLAERYLLGLPGVTSEMLDRRLAPDSAAQRPNDLRSVYLQMLRSLQSPQAMPRVIGGSIGGVERLGAVLFDFDPAAVAAAYSTDADSCARLFARIKDRLSPTGKLRDAPNSTWPKYCKAAASGAAFLARFGDAPAFYRWVEENDADVERRIAAAGEIEKQVYGMGFALACDFLKGLGFHNFSKPDVHLKDIFPAVGLSASTRDRDLFRAISRIAEHVGVTPYAVDMLFWLVGSGDFSPEGPRIPGSKARFIALASQGSGA
ncbi:MAG TPA: hypothetical protein VFR15_19795 [Chloroflexia bacterium]|nr:hypothetical protein [Chloroflexia bacterium]